MESAVSGGRPGQEHPARQGRSHRNYKGIYSRTSTFSEERGEDVCSHGSQRMNGILDARDDRESTGAVTRQSRRAKGSRHKRGRSPDDSLDHRPRENGRCQEKRRRRPSPAQEGRAHRPDCPGRHATRGAARSAWRPKDRTTPRRSPARTTGRGRCEDDRDARPASPKRRRRQPSGPGAREPPEEVARRLLLRVGALQEGLDELRAPGGAFLPARTRRTQPAASQRAWLSWQLAHAGGALHWAAALLGGLLAAPPAPAALGAGRARP